jgi:hypothetical protein
MNNIYANQEENIFQQEDDSLSAGIALPVIFVCFCFISCFLLFIPDIQQVEYHFPDAIYRIAKLYPAVT